MLPKRSQDQRGKSQSQKRLSKGILRSLFLEEKYMKFEIPSVGNKNRDIAAIQIFS